MENERVVRKAVEDAHADVLSKLPITKATPILRHRWFRGCDNDLNKEAMRRLNFMFPTLKFTCYDDQGGEQPTDWHCDLSAAPRK